MGSRRPLLTPQFAENQPLKLVPSSIAPLEPGMGMACLETRPLPVLRHVQQLPTLQFEPATVSLLVTGTLW